MEKETELIELANLFLKFLDKIESQYHLDVDEIRLEIYRIILLKK